MVRKTKNDLFRGLFESSGVATVIARDDGTITHINRHFAELSGYQRRDLEGKKKWSDLIVTSDLSLTRQYREFIGRRTHESAWSHEFKLVTRKGSVRDVLISRGPLEGTDHVLISFADITDIVEVGRQVASSEQKYRSLIESTDDSVYIIDRDCRYVFANRQVLARLCVTEANIIGKHYSDFHSAADTREFVGYVDKVFETSTSHRYEHWHVEQNMCMLRTLSPIFDERAHSIEFLAIVSKDITDLKRTEEKLKYLSLHDPLTGLYNRAYFEEEMHRLDNDRFELVGLIMCDIDGLKLINDTLGHDRGDALLETASQVIRRSFRENDVVARVGGDEFAILLPNSPRSKVEDMRERIKASIEEHNEGNPELPLGISTGFAVRANPGQSMAELYREADNNMYKDKLLGSQHARNAIIKNLLTTIEKDGRLTKQSLKRLKEFVTVLGRSLGLPQKRLKDLSLLARFHDIGNVSIHNRILLKEGSLSADELMEMRKHCDIGHRIAQAAGNLMHIADCILKHHEWWNGKGYPLGLSGMEIPLESRIMAIADAFESMTGGRRYRRPMSRGAAVKELKRCAGSQFDPDLVEKFLGAIDRTDLP